METQIKQFEILKKNRKYFSAKLAGAYPCDIVIDENSRYLELGGHKLEVIDVSVRSKFGTQVIFKLAAAPAPVVEQARVISFQPRQKNEWAIDECRKLGGRWDQEAKAWIFPAFVADKVDVLEQEYNEDFITVEATFGGSVTVERGPVTLYGVVIAEAFNKVRAPRMSDGVALLAGEATSGGSTNHWHTRISAGSVVRFQVPRVLFEEYDCEWDDVSVKQIA